MRGRLFDLLDWSGGSSQIDSNENDKKFAEIFLDRLEEWKRTININILENVLKKYPNYEEIE